MISLVVVLALLALSSGLGSLVDRRFLGLIGHRTGPLIGYGFLTIVSDGFKLCAKNPWGSYFNLLLGFLALGLETIPLAFMPYCLEPGLGFLALLGMSSSVILLSSSLFRGYSPLGRSRVRILLFLGEGIFSFILFSLALIMAEDSLFMMEQDSLVFFTFYAFPGLGCSYFLLCLGERHPWDIPESESDLGGGFGVIYGGINFLWFAVLEYRWLIHWISFCFLMKWAVLSHTINLFILRGLLPRYSFQALFKMLWKNLPWFILSWTFFVLFELNREDCFPAFIRVFLFFPFGWRAFPVAFQGSWLFQMLFPWQSFFL
uniref:NADH dehydrogenase subunit 1 n=2 Tax=Kudoa septempunctata TaxID=751907 RepID=A0A0H5AY14_9CNID|nr:NADH dehydrogenase subunit 1 [Kudoa septempunctata]BAR94676.1 NADH dehydrogenase subunit 1 [Kudoa septempunctata]